ncbi:MAG TPA: LptE family protein [Terriglobia bacterium]|nr:LptE family protein [Terriglobia bacterium]
MKPLSRATAAALAACSVLLTAACGYQVAGTATRLPPDIKTIAVPVFTNKSTRFRIEQKVAAAVTREFIDRTRFRVTPDPEGADAELKGTIISVRSGVLTFDPNTGRATTFQIQVTADVQLIDLHSKKVVFSNPHYLFREQYQVSQSAPALFEESEPALNRLSRDFARTLVTDIMESF